MHAALSHHRHGQAQKLTGYPHAVGSQVAKSEDALAVGYHHDVDLGCWPGADDVCDGALVLARYVHASWTLHDVAVFLARLAHSRCVCIGTSSTSISRHMVVLVFL